MRICSIESRQMFEQRQETHTHTHTLNKKDFYLRFFNRVGEIIYVFLKVSTTRGNEHIFGLYCLH